MQMGFVLQLDRVHTTVQLARYAGAIASKGDVFSLSLIEGITDTNGNFTKNKAVLEGSVELSDFVWDTIHQGMLQFAQNNTVLKDMQIRVAGKTGTAELKASQEDTAGSELGWFSVYNSDGREDDSLLLVTMVEEVNGRGGSGYVVDKDKAILKEFMPKD